MNYWMWLKLGLSKCLIYSCSLARKTRCKAEALRRLLAIRLWK